MKDVGTGLENYLNTEKHMTSCDLFELRLPDGGVHYYTDADKDILYDGHNCIRILSPHLRWGTRWSRSFA